ncbi:MAG TPA: hypothetical protein VGF90_04340 [Verrucomicrobiae bacterium]
MAQNESSSAAGNLFADILKVPAVQSLARRVEQGGALSISGVVPGAQPFFAALLQKIYPQRLVVIVAENLKQQESFQQDLETWLGTSPLFYPAWEILPHEGKLPHADVVSERLQTLVALSEKSTIHNPQTTIVVTCLTALLQKTFTPADLKHRARKLNRDDKIAPLDLVEFLEEQGYEPEAQVSQKGELALRGGILDIFRPARGRCGWSFSETNSNRFVNLIRLPKFHAEKSPLSRCRRRAKSAF